MSRPGSADGLSRFVTALPKVELHVHLEGSIPPALLLELARRNEVELPAADEAGLRRWFEFRDFEQFIEIYVACSRCLRRPEDFQRLVAAFLERQAALGIGYCEAHFTVSTHLAHGLPGDELAAALWEAIEAGERRTGTRLRLIPDIVRNVPRQRADATLAWAVDHRRRGVVALGLSGMESWPSAPFAGHFREAGEEGLRRVAHAGEHGGPESIRQTLAATGAERLGHGIRAVDDPALVAELASRRLPIEVCPTSNLRLGAAADAAGHPFGRLLAAGAAVTVHSDDPALFDTDLVREYLWAAATCGLGAERLAGLALRAVRVSFLPEAERAALESELRRCCAEQGERLLGRPVSPRGVG